jgi:hypothetical protein
VESDSDNKVSAMKNFDIVFLLLTAENSNPNSTWHHRDRLFRLQMPRTAATSDQKRWQMRPNLRRPASELRALQPRFDDAYK